MEQQGITIIEKDLELKDYLDASYLANANWRYGFYGFMILSIIGDIAIKSVSQIIISLAFLGFYELLLRYTSKKNFQSSRILKKQKEVNFSVNGIETKSLDGSVHVITNWDEFSKVKENKKVFYLMTGGTGGHFFLKKNFTPEQLIQFESLIKSMLDSKLFKKENPLKYLGIGVLIRIVLTFVSIGLDRLF